ncbi:MAG: hypothetical protein M1836_002435 [Candelina mexicana]|nr:MAG: hypothetical protein M1836_002435 [Candelina mexicana]
MSLNDPLSEDLLHITLRAMEENIPSLISFSGSQVDQYAWERHNVTLTNGTTEQMQVAEVSLFSLLRKLVGHQLIPKLMGSSFLENFPTFLDDIWELDSGLKWLAFGLPRWVPVWASTKGRLARARLYRNLTVLHRMLDRSAAAMYDDLEWIDVTDVSELMKERNKAWREDGITPERRAPLDLQVLWAVNVTMGHLVYWMIIRILDSPGLVGRIRQEIELSIKASQPEPIFNLPEPPRLKKIGESLSVTCPLLKACYLETLRLNSSPWSVGSICADFVLTSERDGPGGKPKSFVLKQGTTLMIAHNLRNSDPCSFSHPESSVP